MHKSGVRPPVEFVESKFVVEREVVKDVLDECRVVKLPEELELMRHICKISSFAHIEIMRHAAPGKFEYEMEALFQYVTYKNGRCREQAYTCICAAGADGATLHYPSNQKLIRDGDMCLFDMGAEYYCYASDITCSFPASGKFSPAQREIYDIVLQCVKAVESAMKPGVEWTVRGEGAGVGA